MAWAMGLSVFAPIPKREQWPLQLHGFMNVGKVVGYDRSESKHRIRRRASHRILPGFESMRNNGEGRVTIVLRASGALMGDYRVTAGPTNAACGRFPQASASADNSSCWVDRQLGEDVPEPERQRRDWADVSVRLLLTCFP